MTELDLLHRVVQLRQPWLDDVMVFASTIGGAGFVWSVIGAIAFVFPQRRASAWRLLLAVWLTFLVVDGILKPIVHRPRPFEVDQQIRLIDQRPVTASFPSGHAAMAVAGALAGTRVFPAGGWLMWPLAAVIAFSRLYLGVHWPSDVLAGLAIGLGTAWFVLGGRAPDVRATETQRHRATLV